MLGLVAVRRKYPEARLLPVVAPAVAMGPQTQVVRPMVRALVVEPLLVVGGVLARWGR